MFIRVSGVADGRRPGAVRDGDVRVHESVGPCLPEKATGNESRDVERAHPIGTHGVGSCESRRLQGQVPSEDLVRVGGRGAIHHYDGLER